MSAPRVRYDKAPEFVMHYPTCGACDIDLDHDGDGWECPKCGTSWSSNASDGDEGELYPEWSGEEFPEEQPILTHEEGPAAPWIEHPYQAWITSTGHDMRACNRCYKPASQHVGGAS